VKKTNKNMVFVFIGFGWSRALLRLIVDNTRQHLSEKCTDTFTGVDSLYGLCK